MIEVYGKTYAETERELRDSLFRNDGRTCNGFFRKANEGIYFYDGQWVPVAFIRRDGLGPVSVSKHKGRYRYMYALATNDEHWMGVPESYTETVNEAKRLAESLYS